jgi:hypothetical protein
MLNEKIDSGQMNLQAGKVDLLTDGLTRLAVITTSIMAKLNSTGTVLPPLDSYIS